MYKEEKEVRVNRRIIVRKFGREASFLLLFFFFLFSIQFLCKQKVVDSRQTMSQIITRCVLSLYLRCIEFIFEKGILKLIQSFPRLLRMKRIMGDNRCGQVIPVPNPEILNCLKAKW